MDKEPLAILAVSLVAGAAYYVTNIGKASLAASFIEQQIQSMFYLWFSLGIAVWVLVVGLISRSIMKYRDKK